VIFICGLYADPVCSDNPGGYAVASRPEPRRLQGRRRFTSVGPRWPPCRQKEIAGHIRKGCIFRPAVLFLKQGVGYKKNHKEIKVTEAGLKKMMKLV
jgi:hypothetical protein